MSGVRHFLDLIDVPARRSARRSSTIRARHEGQMPDLAGALAPIAARRQDTLAMIFEKHSTRTRVSFDVAMRQLGGDSIMLTAGTTCSSAAARRVADTARVLSRMVDAIMIRADPPRRRSRPCRSAADGAGDQRPDRRSPSLPDHGRPDDLRGASRAARAAAPSPGSATATTSAPAGSHAARTLRLQAAHRLPADCAPPQALLDWARRGRPRSSVGQRSARGGRRRRLRGHRHLGLDGRHRRRVSRHNLLEPYQVDARADGPGQARTPSSCTACPPTAARRSPTR